MIPYIKKHVRLLLLTLSDKKDTVKITDEQFIRPHTTLKPVPIITSGVNTRRLVVTGLTPAGRLVNYTDECTQYKANANLVKDGKDATTLPNCRVIIPVDKLSDFLAHLSTVVDDKFPYYLNIEPVLWHDEERAVPCVSIAITGPTELSTLLP